MENGGNGWPAPVTSMARAGDKPVATVTIPQAAPVATGSQPGQAQPRASRAIPQASPGLEARGPDPRRAGAAGEGRLPGPLPRPGPVEVGCPRPEGCPGGWPPRPRPARPGQASPAALRQAGPPPGPHATARAARGWGSSGQRAWACAYHA